MRKEFLGRGWRFPFQFDGVSGGVGLSEYEENIRQNITIILGTKPGERQMMPEFGCRIHELMFAPATRATAALLKHHVERALERWEPRIEVTNVETWVEAGGTIRVQVSYNVVSTQGAQNLDLVLNAGG